MSMQNLFSEAAQLVEKRESFVLCTVVSTTHSAPRDGGARMLVRSDGSIAGTVGGGPLEAAVISDALNLLKSGGAPTRLFEAALTTNGEVHLGMKCGGAVKVVLDAHRPSPRLHVFGAGHVGLKVAEAATLAGWDVQVLDDRPERLDMLPPGTPRMRFESDAVGVTGAAIRSGDFVVIVTRCHDIDERVLATALPTSARYIGLIGSRHKAAVIFRNLRRQGLPDPSRDPRVFSPIGLAFGGKEPGEIAISVMAELLAVRDAAQVPHRRLPARPVPAQVDASEADVVEGDAPGT